MNPVLLQQRIILIFQTIFYGKGIIAAPMFDPCKRFEIHIFFKSLSHLCFKEIILSNLSGF